MSIRDDVMRKKVPSWVDHLDRPRDIGDKLEGKVKESKMVQQYAFDDEGNIDTSRPLFWDEQETRPKMAPYAIVESPEFGETSVIFNSNAFTALKAELEAMEKDGRAKEGEADLLPDDYVMIEVIGKGKAKSRNFQPPLLYNVEITPGKRGNGVKEDTSKSAGKSGSKASSRSGQSKNAKEAVTPEYSEEDLATPPDGVKQAIWDKLSKEDKLEMLAGF